MNCWEWCHRLLLSYADDFAYEQVVKSRVETITTKCTTWSIPYYLQKVGWMILRKVRWHRICMKSWLLRYCYATNTTCSVVGPDGYLHADVLALQSIHFLPWTSLHRLIIELEVVNYVGESFPFMDNLMTFTFIMQFWFEFGWILEG